MDCNRTQLQHIRHYIWKEREHTKMLSRVKVSSLEIGAQTCNPRVFRSVKPFALTDVLRMSSE